MSNSTFTISTMTPEDVRAATYMRLQSWLDTYVNEDHGVSREWIEEHNKQKSTDEAIERRIVMLGGKNSKGFIAKDEYDVIIGAAMPYQDTKGIQHVGSLYVDKVWHGKGVGGALMKEIINWSNPGLPIILSVATYNERAKAFYRKWGFVEIPGSNALFDDKIPEIKMIRKGDKQ